jgi:hypothetical protein
LPAECYTLAELQAAGFGPDVLTLQTPPDVSPTTQNGGAATRTRPRTRFVAELPDAEFYRRKKNSIAIRHVSGDRIVAVVEIVPRGNKSSRNALRSFVTMACEFLEIAFN